MIPVSPSREPGDFDRDCRAPGNLWLAANPGVRNLPAFWTRFQPRLESGFSRRCGWWAVRIVDGAVDHFLSKKNHRHLAYERSNYRYIAASVNSSKRDHDAAVLDPFEVRAGWFEVILPSMQLVRTALVPARLKVKADFSIQQLKLTNGHKIRAIRKRYYEDCKTGKLTETGLADYAPLVAAAVRRWRRTEKSLP
jgi:hypothetical protein